MYLQKIIKLCFIWIDCIVPPVNVLHVCVFVPMWMCLHHCSHCWSQHTAINGSIGYNAEKIFVCFFLCHCMKVRKYDSLYCILFVQIQFPWITFNRALMYEHGVCYLDTHCFQWIYIFNVWLGSIHILVTWIAVKTNQTCNSKWS